MEKRVPYRKELPVGPCAHLTSVNELVKCIEENAYTIEEAVDRPEDSESEIGYQINITKWQESVPLFGLGK